jgi:hypothetical protein
MIHGLGRSTRSIVTIKTPTVLSGRKRRAVNIVDKFSPWLSATAPINDEHGAAADESADEDRFDDRDDPSLGGFSGFPQWTAEQFMMLSETGGAATQDDTRLGGTGTKELFDTFAAELPRSLPRHGTKHRHRARRAIAAEESEQQDVRINYFIKAEHRPVPLTERIAGEKGEQRPRWLYGEGKHAQRGPPLQYKVKQYYFSTFEDLHLLIRRWTPFHFELLDHYDHSPQYAETWAKGQAAIDDHEAVRLGIYTAKDLNTCCWILSAKTPDETARRYIEVVSGNVDGVAATIPLFIPIQILRAEEGSLSTAVFRPLVRALQQSIKDVAIDVPLMLATYLGFRLLDHAREIAPDAITVITELTMDILLTPKQYIEIDSEHLQQLAECCNQLLISIGRRTKERRKWVIHRQRAQVSMVQRMLQHRPELPLDRAGYRALIAVQLLHTKTPEEVAWALAKSESWPPWRKDRTGMEARFDYPGQESRAIKLLRRMNEAGYAHGTWELAARVLAGWDTDNSPTIQTRAYLPVDSLGDGDLGLDRGERSLLVWAARVQATRTIREAWAAFLSYQKSPSYRRPTDILRGGGSAVYHAMFKKLLAPEHEAGAGSVAVPGDYDQTWPDPPSPMDHIYVEREIPSARQLYGEMRQDGFLVGEFLLADLIELSDSMVEAMDYVQDSAVDRSTKDLLLKFHMFAQKELDARVPRVHRAVLASFVHKLFAVKDKASFLRLGIPWSEENVAVEQPAHCALGLIDAVATRRQPLLAAALAGLEKRLLKRGMDQEKENLMAIWHASEAVAKLVFKPSPAEIPTFGIFRRMSQVQQGLVYQSIGDSALGIATEHQRSRIKDLWSLFWRCAYPEMNAKGKQNVDPMTEGLQLTFVPDAKDFRMLAESLYILNDRGRAIALVRWMAAHAEQILAGANQHVEESALWNLQVVMIIARIVIEQRMGNVDGDGRWDNEGLTETLQDRLYVPSAEDCVSFAEERRRLLALFRRADRFRTNDTTFQEHPSSTEEDDLRRVNIWQ